MTTAFEYWVFLPQMRLSFDRLMPARAAEAAGFAGMGAWTISRRRSPRASRCTRR